MLGRSQCFIGYHFFPDPQRQVCVACGAVDTTSRIEVAAPRPILGVYVAFVFQSFFCILAARWTLGVHGTLPPSQEKQKQKRAARRRTLHGCTWTNRRYVDQSAQSCRS